MNYIIGGVGILICLFAAGYFIRRKYYGTVDELESWKIDIMNRPVLNELSKVKKLNMIGQTEELFEKWRADWDGIVTDQLPELEELLFDTEESIDKYKFRKAKELQKKIRVKLESMESSIETMLEELNNLIGSEEKNRTEIDALKESYRESKKTLLAHRHSFGETESKIEEMLQETTVKLKEYEEKTNNGDYLEAREIIHAIEKLTGDIRYLIDNVPPLLIECQTKLPEQLNDLKDGYADMLEQGFILEHIQLETEVKEIEVELEESNKLLVEGKIEQVQNVIAEVQEKLDLLYDLLEKEVIARNYWNKNLDPAKAILEEIREGNSRLQVEVSLLQRSYNLNDEDLELQFKLEKRLKLLYKQYEVLEHKLLTESAAHTILSEELKVLKEQLESASKEQEDLFDKLHALRKDEVAAHEKMTELTKQMTNALRMVANSNLPGVTAEYNELAEETKEAMAKLKTVLQEAPLDLPTVQSMVENAEHVTHALVNATEELVETVLLAEKVIQYGNRYRRKYPKAEKSLAEAEMLFRKYRYKEALEQAAAAVEEIEPGSMKRMEALIGDLREKQMK
ncbi:MULTISPECIES: septation ring formation regulator EzrA [Bacillaceae]|uniref:septation ring formation regulator EzrA n=1 Tax=Bacillaceae TaxID=186817 RepID=UPI001E3BF768|nr:MULTISPECIES: septation ring formation regulator EzrA [Bacillaceae]MCE4051161.1 septation ring formation regulator EzrA [Bacillus sp. Au-Bac7]MCM3029838.1 septation ring formation regulator EzrA [Niallia sp. MER 6]MDL0436696.1 septation ring formation regulator EzrA [Niallia sp. SS-2023]UPO86867.1 septation ring formation regulator EzrA [Niallia sp. Man26]